MTAKDEFLSRLEYLGAAKDLPALMDQGIVPCSHNGVANLLRKGLAIVAFNILEDFIKKRTGEALRRLSTSRIPFNKLTPQLQDASIIDALNALAFRAKLEKKDGGDWKSLVQSEALKIHSTKNEIFEISELSFASSSSNVTADEVSKILSAFGISGGWNTLKRVSDSIGGGLPDLGQAYKNATERRHNAAHEANFSYDYQWLVAIRSEILAIAASLDILLEARCRQIESSILLDIKDHVIDNALQYRFLEVEGVLFKERRTVGGRSIKNWSTLPAALAEIRPKLKNNSEFLIVMGSGKRISEWFVS